MNVIRSSFRLAFEISPILLTGGIASNVPGGMLPIAVFTEGLSIANGLLLGNGVSVDQMSTRFTPSAGTTLIMQDVSQYPFLNQATAANAVVQKPNRVVMQMTRPANTKDGGYINRGVSITALKAALDNHNKAGGTYIVMTPAFVYTDCLLTSFTDIAGFSEQNKQVQYSWSLEFIQPLLYASQLDSVMNGLLNAITDGSKAAKSLSWSGMWQAVKQEFIP